MTISPDKINRIIEDMNNLLPKVSGEWLPSDVNYTFSNDLAISQIVDRLMFLFMENHSSKDLFVDMMLKELMIRILRSENRFSLVSNSKELASTHRVASVIDYIKENLDKSLSIAELSKTACMSESNFFKVFRNEMDLTPIEFINNERIKRAAQMLRTSNVKIKEVYIACGFNNVSYFVRIFKKFMGKTPTEYRHSFKEH